MREKEFEGLKIGDVVRHVSSGNSYVITNYVKDGYVATNTLIIYNPPEWKKVGRKL